MKNNARKLRAPGRKGFTLVELMLSMAISLIVLVIVGSMLRSSFKLSSSMRSMTDATDNVYQALTKIVNDLMQAGAYLPQLDTAISLSGDTVTIWSNPREAYFPVTFDSTNDSINVQDARPFKGLTTVRHFHYTDTNPTMASRTLSYVDTVKNILCFSGNVPFSRADVLFSRSAAKYYLDKSLKQILYKPAAGSADPIAENVDSLRFFFKDSIGAITNSWARMRACSVCVTVHPQMQSRKMSTVCRRFFFRNRVK